MKIINDLEGSDGSDSSDSSTSSEESKVEASHTYRAPKEEKKVNLQPNFKGSK